MLMLQLVRSDSVLLLFNAADHTFLALCRNAFFLPVRHAKHVLNLLV